ncbi:hypothetical protein L9F63_012830, partial [Diploptera punctata]
LCDIIMNLIQIVWIHIHFSSSSSLVSPFQGSSFGQTPPFISAFTATVSMMILKKISGLLAMVLRGLKFPDVSPEAASGILKSLKTTLEDTKHSLWQNCT